VDDDVAAVTTDTWIDEELSAAVNGSGDDLRVDGVSEQGLAESAFVRFDVSSLPVGVVTNTVLRLATNADVGSASLPGSQFSIHAVGEPWAEGEASWSQASEGVPWSVLGCAAAPCRGELELGFLEPTEQSHAYEVALDPAIVEAWRDDPAENHGLMLVTQAENGVHFHSSESADDTMRPALEVRVCPDG
jgi:hypothetical protein